MAKRHFRQTEGDSELRRTANEDLPCECAAVVVHSDRHVR